MRLTSFQNGFWPSCPIAGSNVTPNSIRECENIILLPGDPSGALFRSAKLLGSSVGISDSQLHLVGNSGVGRLPSGSIIQYFQSTWFAGAGPVFVDSSSIGNAQATIQFKLGNNVFPVGFSVPPKPAFGMPSMTGKNNGSYAIQLTRGRSATGYETNAGPPSDPISVQNKKIPVMIPAVANGQDIWNIYATASGFGTQGPFLFLKQLMIPADVPAGGGLIQLDWYNSELAAGTPPTNHNIPFPTLFIASLQDVLISIGAFDGTIVQCSIPGDFESWPGQYIITTTPGSIPIGVCTRPINNDLIYWTPSNIQNLVYTGDQLSNPVFIRAVWGLAGVQNRHGLCIAMDEIYCYSSVAGFARILTDGNIDTSFARAVETYARDNGWDASTTVVGYDQRYDHVVFFNGTEALYYSRKLQAWGRLKGLPGTPVSCITRLGVLLIGINGGLFQYESGTGAAWKAKTQNLNQVGNSSGRMTLYGVEVIVNSGATLTTKVFVNFKNTPEKTLTDNGSGARHTEWTSMNLLGKEIQVEVSGTGADHEVAEIILADYSRAKGSRFPNS